MSDTSDLPVTGVDFSRPSTARVYDYLLGGAHNVHVDRELARQIQAMTPNIAETMRANRAFLRRAVRFLVDRGIRQFLDVGSGIPTIGNVHEVAGAVAPDAVVVYVDVDPAAVAHSRAILRDHPAAAVVRGDLRDPSGLLAAVAATGLIDLGRPVGLLLAGVVHFVADHDHPQAAVAALRGAVAPGSYLVVSHVTFERQPPEVIEAQRLSARTGTEIALRSAAEIAGYFGDFALVDPGLVFLTAWRPEPDQPDPEPAWVGAYAGVGRKP